jgi:uncharacterized protein YndB with AHSA1/START domain
LSRTAHTVEIARPPGDVFPHLVEPELMKRWIGGLVEFEPLDEGPRAGARSHQRVEQAGRTLDVESQIVELVSGQRLAVRSDAHAFTTMLTYELEPTAAGTRLTGTADTRLKGIGRLLRGIAGRAAERKLAGDLERLKRLLDGGL